MTEGRQGGEQQQPPPQQPPPQQPSQGGGGGNNGNNNMTTYDWDDVVDAPPPSADALNLWSEVGNTLDKSQTVVWKNAVNSLDFALRYLRTSKDARYFVEKYMSQIIGILVEQNPSKCGGHERNCVQESLFWAVSVVALDLQIQLERNGKSTLLNTLAPAFDKKKLFYKGSKGQWNVNHMHGLPDVRIKTIAKFKSVNGFVLLNKYIRQKTETAATDPSEFPNLGTLHHILLALYDVMGSGSGGGSNKNQQNRVNATVGPPPPGTADLRQQQQRQQQERNRQEGEEGGDNGDTDVPEDEAINNDEVDDAVMISNAVINYVNNSNEDALKKIPADLLKALREDLRNIFDRLILLQPVANDTANANQKQQQQRQQQQPPPPPTLLQQQRRRNSAVEFYAFWRGLALKLITSQSLPLKLFGWEEVGELIRASAWHRPPPKGFDVTSAGCSFVNGVYTYAGQMTIDGYHKEGGEISYVRAIPPDEQPGGGKKLTLFRCTMRSQQKWWFLSEADEEQPGTDRDIDYYQHKSKEHEEGFPPPDGWYTCRSAGIDPPPHLEPFGVVCPAGQEYETLDHQLARWAIENEIVEQVLGDTTIHREVVARSTVLIKFLAEMCDRYPPLTSPSISSSSPAEEDKMTDSGTPSPPQQQQQEDDEEPSITRYCLQAHHLLFAWKTCLRKADAAVSSQVYYLLVSILPLCPTDLAIPLLKAVQTSLRESQPQEKRNYLFEVSEFCSALAQGGIVDNSSNKGGGGSSNAGAAATPGLKEEVREEALNLLWSVLTHRDASSLRTYDTLKRYVTYELRVEPKGREHRDKFMESCIKALADNTKADTQEQVDEVQALRMVKLTHFVLDACPRDQADQIVTENSGALPDLLFRELSAYLSRRKDGANTGFVKRSNNKPVVVGTSTSSTASSTQANNGASSGAAATDPDLKQHLYALNERLRILRHVYGLSHPHPHAPPPPPPVGLGGVGGPVEVDGGGSGSAPGAPIIIMMTSQMLETLWGLCDAPDDRSALMVFIANASQSRKVSEYDQVAAATTTAAGVNPTPALPQTPAAPQSEQLLSAAFPEDVCRSVFLNLFCSPSFSYDLLGEGAYRSFQTLFSSARMSPLYTSEMKETALDALWRICLTAVDDTVASRAMKDLLNVYISSNNAEGNGQPQPPNARDDIMITDEKDDSFGERMFQCLARVKQDLDAGSASAGRSAERCLRILNAAIGQNSLDGHSITSSSLVRLSLLSMNIGLANVFKCLPHGMRGQSSYRRVGVLAKRPPVSQNHSAKQVQGKTSRDPQRFPLDLHPLETLASVKAKVAEACQCPVTSLKPVQVNGRARSAGSGETSHMNVNVIPDDSVVDEIGIVEGCEIVFLIAERPMQNNSVLPAAKPSREGYSNDLSAVFFDDDGELTDRLFSMLLGILKALPWKQSDDMADTDDSLSSNTHKLVWDFLLAMPTNSTIALQVKSAQGRSGDEPSITSEEDAMEVETTVNETWNQLLDTQNFDRSVYVLLTIDAFLRPAKEVLSILPAGQRETLQRQMEQDSSLFRRSFIEAGGFEAVVRFFSASEGSENAKRGRTRRGNAVALRVLKTCLFGDKAVHSQNDGDDVSVTPDDVGARLLNSLSDTEGLLKSLTSMVVDDPGISSSTILDVLRFLRLLFKSPPAAQSFVSLPDGMPERLLIIPLLHQEELESTRSINTTMHVRRCAHDLILQTPILADKALPWLIKAVDNIDVTSESTNEYFDVLEKLVSDDHATARSGAASEKELRELGTMVCKKLASCPRPVSESDSMYHSTGVLCGCLKLLRALIEHGGREVLQPGTNALISETGVPRWSEEMKSPASSSVFAVVSSTFSSKVSNSNDILIDLIGAIFDGFLSPSGSSTVAICCDRESRRIGFGVVGAAARSCKGGDGYMALVDRVSGLISGASPNLRNRWDQFGGGSHEPNTRAKGSSKYSGLRNQGCTCYMNSVLQQLFMMTELRHSMCSAPLPSSLRSSGGMSSRGGELVGKKISLQWENGVSYEAVVEKFHENTGTHVIRYCPILVATVSGMTHHQIDPEETNRLPPQLPDEFILSEGRPGKETGVYDLVKDSTSIATAGGGTEDADGPASSGKMQETVDETASRHLLEEVQRTFIHLDEGSRGRCFDPRALVEACACLKLEFDVWQQNDASEFTTKFLDRLEISLKKYAPKHFRYIDHTFGLKQTKQKICKECGLKTNREEKLLNIDCQIRGKTDIHEALAAMTEVEIMEGSNRVFCDRCKKNTDTILRTALSTLPNMLILSLKRFDLDFNTFETVKLNSRCAFGETLNMKEYTLEGQDSMENSHQAGHIDDPTPMETDEETRGNEKHEERLNKLPDDDYEYRLAGVLVHAGVAQGGHYYSFIKDRSPGSEEKWYRFDDEDVSSFDPTLIESECFGGKVKKETKWPNGQVHTVEQEQFANALMLFYEKVKPSDAPSGDEKDEELDPSTTTSGYDVFKADVKRSNAAHRWQSFLFDSEFQEFMKGLLELCGQSGGQRSTSMTDSSDALWRQAVLQMLLTFVFDVILYSSDRGFLGDWTRMLEEALVIDRQSGKSFVHNLAKRSREVSSNWLRTYLLDCPDQDSRAASVRIFSAAMKSCLSWEDEIKALEGWRRAWEDQYASITRTDSIIEAMPCTLVGKWSTFEDIDRLDSGCTASSVGIILSFLNVLLEALPRFSRFSIEVCSFIRELATLYPGDSSSLLRQAMDVSLIPPRLIALATREHLCPPHYRCLFPGASVSLDVANTQARTESNHSAHAMPMSGNHVMHTSEMNNPRNPTGADYMMILEALACIGGLPGIKQATLVHDNGDMARNRRRFSFTEEATQALTTLFEEHCAAGAPGMGQREIEQYLRTSRYDASNITPQKIMDLLTKYPTSPSGGVGVPTYLSLAGFLAYYRDVTQTNDMQLRHDLQIFGFRPDLSRRSETARYHHIGERKHMCDPAESIALDVAEKFGDQQVPFGVDAQTCLLESYHLYTLALGISEPLAMYLLAGATYKQDCSRLIQRTLFALYRSPNDWSANDGTPAATRIFQVVASLPCPEGDANISEIMDSNATQQSRNFNDGKPHGIGLLRVLRCLLIARQTQHYNNDLNWTFTRYIDIIKALRKNHAVFTWMDNNRSKWAFIEGDILDNRPAVSHQTHQIRGDYGTREGVSMPLDHHNHSDSDLQGDMNDSDDDEDSQFDRISDNIEGGSSSNDGPFQVVVAGAGNAAVNGTYHQDGYFQDACRYVMEGRWNGQLQRFYIFQCNVSNNTKHWYISIVPNGSNPGTSSDIDFYSAPVNEDCRHSPPSRGWMKAPVGTEPAPFLEFQNKPKDGVNEPEEIWNGAVEDDENADSPSSHVSNTRMA